MAYASHALATGDLDLAATTMDRPQLAGHELGDAIGKAQAQRRRTQRAHRVLRLFALFLTCAVIATLAMATVLVWRAKDDAVSAEREKTDAAQRALAAEMGRQRNARLIETSGPIRERLHEIDDHLFRRLTDAQLQDTYAELDGIITELDMLIPRWPDEGLLHLIKGRALMMRWREAEAITELDQAVELGGGEVSHQLGVAGLARLRRAQATIRDACHDVMGTLMILDSTAGIDRALDRQPTIEADLAAAEASLELGAYDKKILSAWILYFRELQSGWQIGRNSSGTSRTRWTSVAGATTRSCCSWASPPRSGGRSSPGLHRGPGPLPHQSEDPDPAGHGAHLRRGPRQGPDRPRPGPADETRLPPGPGPPGRGRPRPPCRLRAGRGGLPAPARGGHPPVLGHHLQAEAAFRQRHFAEALAAQRTAVAAAAADPSFRNSRNMSVAFTEFVRELGLTSRAAVLYRTIEGGRPDLLYRAAQLRLARPCRPRP